MNQQNTQEVELSLFHCMINDQETLVNAATMLSPALFSDKTNRQIFAYLRDQSSKSGKVDQALASFEITSLGEEATERYFEILNVGSRVVNPSWGSSHKYADRIILAYQRVNLVQKLESAKKLCEEGTHEDFSELHQDVVSMFAQDPYATDKQKTVFGPKELADDFYERVATAGDKVDSIPTGFTLIDEYTGGLKPGKLIVIGGRPSMGKTSLALNIAEHVSFVEKKKVLFVSLEMKKDDLVDRIACVHLRLGTQAMDKKATWDDATKGLVAGVCETIQQSQLFVSDEMKYDVDSLIALVKLQHTLVGVDVVIVDYLQLLSSSGYKGNKVGEVSDITRKMKLLSLDINAPVILLSQLNRGSESRADKRPTMADLRDSGSIEQDADIIFFVSRNKPNEIDKREPDLGDNEARILLEKQRGGPITDKIVLGFRADQTRFLNQITK